MEGPTPTAEESAQNAAGSSAQQTEQQGGSTPSTTEEKPLSAEELQKELEIARAQLEKANTSISKLTSNNADLLQEKRKTVEERRAKETDLAKLNGEYKAENESLLKERDELKKRLERFEEMNRKAFKETVAKIEDKELRAMYSDPERFTLEDVTLLVERLNAQKPGAKSSNVAKPPASNGEGTPASLEAAIATGDAKAINKAFDALLKNS